MTNPPIDQLRAERDAYREALARFVEAVELDGHDYLPDEAVA